MTIDGSHLRRSFAARSTRFGAGREACALVLALTLVCGLAAGIEAAELVDTFADRQVLTTPSGSLNGNNLTATSEVGEPRHGGRAGGRSMWISWQAPADGVATFSTADSTFDTLLSAYVFASTNSTTFDQLRETARNDNEGTNRTSLIEFGAVAGRRYEIAVDGYRGASGAIQLEWRFLNATSPPPIIVSVPNDRAVRVGETVTLRVDLQVSPESDAKFQWRFNGEGNLPDVETPTLVLTNFQATNVGTYVLRIDWAGKRIFTAPVELQINSDGQTNTLARDKLFDAVESGLEPEDEDGGRRGPGLRAASQLSAAAVGVSRGYNGVQVFNTVFATVDPDEPRHCNANGGASYWYAYHPPANGLLSFDTTNSRIPTILAVYKYLVAAPTYADLIPMECNINPGSGSQSGARVELSVTRSNKFLVVVDGLNGVSGVVHLNYRLITNRAQLVPRLTHDPEPQRVAPRSSVTLEPPVTGAPPLTFAWRKGDILLPDATRHALQMTNVTAADAGEYFVTVSNQFGVLPNIALPLIVLEPPEVTMSLMNEGSALQFRSVAGLRYILEHTSALGEPWEAVTNTLVGNGSILVLSNAVAAPRHFFRLRVE